MEDADLLKEKYKADLVIYGLAQNVEPSCAGAEVCFRYVLDESFIKKETPNNINSFNHNLDFVSTSPYEIQKGYIQLELKYITYWVSALALKKQHKYELAIDCLNRIFDELKIINLEVYNLLYDCYLLLQKPKLAIHKSLEILSYSPFKEFIYDRIGKTYCLVLKDYQKSIEYYSKLIEIAPDNYKYYNERGTIYWYKQDFELAIKDFNKALELEPNNQGSYLMKGQVFQKLKKYEDAIKDFKKLEKLMSGPNIFTNRVIAESHRENKKYRKAIKYYNKSITINSKSHIPFNSIAYYGRAFCFFYIGDTLNSIKDIDRVLLNKVYIPSYYPDLGGLALKNKYWQGAEKCYELAINKHKKHPYYYNNLGFARIKLGKLESVYKLLQTSKKLDDKNSWVYRNLAYYYSIKGEKELAKKNLKKALELGYDDIKWIKKEQPLNEIYELL